MTATATAPEVQKRTYAMPRAYIGMAVVWYQGGSEAHAPYPGIVCTVGQRSVDIVVFDATGRIMGQVGCRHMGDREANEHDRKNSGGWDYTEGSRPASMIPNVNKKD